MIISRTPYRVSFIGGGTDYPAWYQEHGAAVLSTAINHYCYLKCHLQQTLPHANHQATWDNIIPLTDHSDSQPAAINAVLSHLKFQQDVVVRHQGSLPARSGLGSSSAFTVGLLHALHTLRGTTVEKHTLADEAIHIERHILNENVGVQDQIATAFGGLNKIIVHPNGRFEVTPIDLPPTRLAQLESCLLLFFTGVARTASDIAAEQIRSIPDKQRELHRMRDMVDTAESILCSSSDLDEFGALLHEGWLLKQTLSAHISNNFIDGIYEKARRAGAIGGKLLGAGGGGFMLLYVRPEKQAAVRAALHELMAVPFQVEHAGSEIIFKA